jgi:osmotically-inducible protein OsmY
LSIAQDAIIGIVYLERIPVTSLEVTCEKGVVSLHGTARSQGASDRCVSIAGAVKGVTRVVSYIEVAQFTYYPGV